MHAAAAADPLDAWVATPLAQVTPGTPPYPVAYARGAFYAAGTTNSFALTLKTSPDGVTWTNGPMVNAAQQSLSTISAANGMLLLGFYHGAMAFSFDASPATWSYAAVSWPLSLTGAAFGNGQWAMPGGGAVVVSSDLKTFRRAPTGSTSGDGRILFAKGMFILLSAGAGGGGGAILTSPDGVNWTSRFSGHALHALASWRNGVVAVGDGGAVVTSADGISRALGSVAGLANAPAVANVSLRGLAYGKGGFVAVGGNGSSPVVYSSPSGRTWTAHTISAPITTLDSIAFGETSYVATGVSSSGQLSAFAR